MATMTQRPTPIHDLPSNYSSARPSRMPSPEPLSPASDDEDWIPEFRSELERNQAERLRDLESQAGEDERRARERLNASLPPNGTRERDAQREVELGKIRLVAEGRLRAIRRMLEDEMAQTIERERELRLWSKKVDGGIGAQDAEMEVPDSLRKEQERILNMFAHGADTEQGGNQGGGSTSSENEARFGQRSGADTASSRTTKPSSNLSAAAGAAHVPAVQSSLFFASANQQSPSISAQAFPTQRTASTSSGVSANAKLWTPPTSSTPDNRFPPGFQPHARTTSSTSSNTPQRMNVLSSNPASTDVYHSTPHAYGQNPSLPHAPLNSAISGNRKASSSNPMSYQTAFTPQGPSMPPKTSRIVDAPVYGGSFHTEPESMDDSEFETDVEAVVGVGMNRVRAPAMPSRQTRSFSSSYEEVTEESDEGGSREDDDTDDEEGEAWMERSGSRYGHVPSKSAPQAIRGRTTSRGGRPPTANPQLWKPGPSSDNLNAAARASVGPGPGSRPAHTHSPSPRPPVLGAPATSPERNAGVPSAGGFGKYGSGVGQGLGLGQGAGVAAGSMRIPPRTATMPMMPSVSPNPHPHPRSTTLEEAQIRREREEREEAERRWDSHDRMRSGTAQPTYGSSMSVSPPLARNSIPIPSASTHQTTAEPSSFGSGSASASVTGSGSLREQQFWKPKDSPPTSRTTSDRERERQNSSASAPRQPATTSSQTPVKSYPYTLVPNQDTHKAQRDDVEMARGTEDLNRQGRWEAHLQTHSPERSVYPGSATSEGSQSSSKTTPTPTVSSTPVATSRFSTDAPPLSGRRAPSPLYASSQDANTRQNIDQEQSQFPDAGLRPITVFMSRQPTEEDVVPCPMSRDRSRPNYYGDMKRDVPSFSNPFSSMDPNSSPTTSFSDRSSHEDVPSSFSSSEPHWKEAAEAEERQRQKEEEQRRKDAELRRLAEELEKKRMEMEQKAREIQQREELVARREEEQLKKEAEKTQKEQEQQRRQQELFERKRNEVEMRKQEELLRQAAERKHEEETRRAKQESMANAFGGPGKHASFSSASGAIGGFPGRASTASSSASSTYSSASSTYSNWSSSSTRSTSSSATSASAASNSSRASASSSSSSTWTSGTRPTGNASASNTRSESTPKPTSSAWKTSSGPGASSTSSASGTSASTGSGSHVPPMSEADHKRFQEEQARRQQEQFRKQSMREDTTKARATAAAMGPEQVQAAWARYERGCERMKDAKQGELRWNDIPWLVLRPPTSPEDLTTNAVAALLLSTNHSANKTKKERIKEQQLRWHPDRFEHRWLPKVHPSDYEKVKEGGGAVSRALNELLTRESAGSVFD